MIKQIEEDQRMCEQSDDATIPMSIYNRKKTLEKHNAVFIYLHILIDTILRTKPTLEKSKRELMKVLRQHYLDNPTQIDEFEHIYDPAKAIWWYTSASFVYDTVNKVLREYDFDILSSIYTISFLKNDL